MPQAKLDHAGFRVENPKPDHPGEAVVVRMMQSQDGPAKVSVDDLFWMDRNAVAATHGRGLSKINRIPTVEVDRVFTAENNSMDPKTVFNPGEKFFWVIDVMNCTGADASVDLTWEVTDPTGAQLYYSKVSALTPPGLKSWWLVNYVLDIRGTHTFIETVDYLGYVTQDTTKYMVPSADILFVDDDDNDPDVRTYYAETLAAYSDLTFYFWDTGNSDTNEPDEADLGRYPVVIWFTGDVNDSAVGPSAASEAALASWLDESGGCLMISSQDYYDVKGLTSLMQNYLGVSTVNQDQSYGAVTGQGSVFGGLGTYNLIGIFENWSDAINPDGSAAVAFSYSQGTAAISKSNGTYKTTYWGFPFEFLPGMADRVDAMGKFLYWCGLDPYRVNVPLVLR
jgi:hypothetical protein